MKYEIKWKENRQAYVEIIEGKNLDECIVKYEALKKRIHKENSEVKARKI